MKNLFIAIALILITNISAQEGTEKTNVFVRVYDLQNKLMRKGRMLSVSDTSLELKRKKKIMLIAFDSVGLIKTHRSAGHNALIGAAVVAPLFAMTGAASTNSDWDNETMLYSTGQGAAIGAVLGAITGAVLGGIANNILKTKPQVFEINGDKLKWQEFKETITGLSNSKNGLFEEPVEYRASI